MLSLFWSLPAVAVNADRNEAYSHAWRPAGAKPIFTEPAPTVRADSAAAHTAPVTGRR